MYYPYFGYIDSCYFYTPTYTPIYFTCEPIENSPKTASSIVLIKTKSEATKNSNLSEQSQKPEENHCYRQCRQKKQIHVYTQKRTNKIKTQNQAKTKRQYKLSKPLKHTKIAQKQGRNSHSNILRKFFKLLSTEREYRTKVQRIIKNLNIKFTVETYFSQMGSKNIDHRNYIRIKQVEGIFQDNKNWVNKITRILFQDYLQNYYVKHLLSSKKTDSKSVWYHLRGKRTIRDEIYAREGSEDEQFYNGINEND